MRLTIRKRVSAAALLMAIAIGLTAASAAPASATTMTGTYVAAFCPAGQAVEGLWFSGGGYAGWARWVQPLQGGESFGFAVPTWSNVRLSLGCGGSPAQWAHSYTAYLYVGRTPIAYYTMDCYYQSYPTCPAY